MEVTGQITRNEALAKNNACLLANNILFPSNYVNKLQTMQKQLNSLATEDFEQFNQCHEMFYQTQLILTRLGQV